jgi:inosine-uridine nucleoside N-ribohydrolase
MGKPWGGSEPKDSEAAQFIIKTVRDLPDGEMIYVVCTGATTNLASAIALAPEIAPRIKLYLMGFQYEDEAGVWNKSEFNVRRDLNAADFVLNQSDLEVHIMSATLSKSYRFDRADTFRRLESLGEIGAYFKAKWTEKYSDFDRWTMWDLALVQAMIRPELAREHQVATPPENTQRTVWVYHAIDVEAMTADFWAAMDESDAKQK